MKLVRVVVAVAVAGSLCLGYSSPASAAGSVKSDRWTASSCNPYGPYMDCETLRWDARWVTTDSGIYRVSLHTTFTFVRSEGGQVVSDRTWVYREIFVTRDGEQVMWSDTQTSRIVDLPEVCKAGLRFLMVGNDLIFQTRSEQCRLRATAP